MIKNTTQLGCTSLWVMCPLQATRWTFPSWKMAPSPPGDKNPPHMLNLCQIHLTKIHIWTFSGSEISIRMTQRDQRTSNWCNWKKGPVLSAFQLFPGWCSVCIPVFPIVPAENPIFIPYSLHVKLPRWNLHESCRRISTEDILSSTTASQSMEWWDVDEHRCSVAPRCTVGGT